MPDLSTCSAPSHRYTSACIRSSPLGDPDHDADRLRNPQRLKTRGCQNGRGSPRPSDGRRAQVATPSPWEAPRDRAKTSAAPVIRPIRCTTQSEPRGASESDRLTISIVTAIIAVQFNVVYLPQARRAVCRRPAAADKRYSLGRTLRNVGRSQIFAHRD
jgi:hypothetical protein